MKLVSFSDALRHHSINSQDKPRKHRGITLALFGGFIVQLAALQIFHGPTVCGCVGWFAFLFPELKVLHGLVIDGMICGVLSYSIVKNLSESKKLPDCA